MAGKEEEEERIVKISREEQAWSEGYEFMARALADEPVEVLQATARALDAELQAMGNANRGDPRRTAIYGGLRWITEHTG